MQNGTNSQGPDAATLRAQIREQVRQQVQAARQQAEAARASAGQQVGGTGVELPQAPNAPVVVVSPPGSRPDFYIPPRAEHIAIEFFAMVVAIFFVVPIARAFARRIDKKPVANAVDAGVMAQMQRIENTVDSMAIEIERISEAQRYMARLQSGK